MRSAAVALALGLPSRRRASPCRPPRSARAARRPINRSGPPIECQGNTPYDGRVRVHPPALQHGLRRVPHARRPPWSHDYPRGEVHFTKILKEITYDQAAHRRLQHPVARRSGALQLSGRLHGGARVLVADRQGDRELPRLPEKGRVRDLRRLPRRTTGTTCRTQMRRVLPEARWIEIDGSEPVWHSFFEIPDPMALAPHRSTAGRCRRRYWGIFEDNDPTKRLIAIANVERRHQRILGVFRHRLRAGRSRTTKPTSTASTT